MPVWGIDISVISLAMLQWLAKYLLMVFLQLYAAVVKVYFLRGQGTVLKCGKLLLSLVSIAFTNQPPLPEIVKGSWSRLCPA